MAKYMSFSPWTDPASGGPAEAMGLRPTGPSGASGSSFSPHRLTAIGDPYSGPDIPTNLLGRVGGWMLRSPRIPGTEQGSTFGQVGAGGTFGQVGAGGATGRSGVFDLMNRYYNPKNWGTGISDQYTQSAMRGIDPAYQEAVAKTNQYYAQRGMLGSTEHNAALQNLEMDRGRAMTEARDYGFQQQQGFTSNWLQMLLELLLKGGSLSAALGGGPNLSQFLTGQ